MHLANGTLTNDVCTLTAALSTAAICYAATRAIKGSTPARVLKAVIGSGIVLMAQMIDVSLFNDFTVHVVGAAFLALLAGPALALLGMASVVVTQALALNDGGIITLGANVFNMAVVGVSVSALTIRLARRRPGSRAGLLIAAPLAGAASVVAATFVMTAELALSGVSLASALSLTLPAHAPFAVWEAASTFVLVLLAATMHAIKPIPASTSSN